MPSHQGREERDPARVEEEKHSLLSLALWYSPSSCLRGVGAPPELLEVTLGPPIRLAAPEHSGEGFEADGGPCHLAHRTRPALGQLEQQPCPGGFWEL